MKAVHIQLTYEGRNVCVLKVLAAEIVQYRLESPKAHRHLRKHFREVVRWRHDEALLGRRPADEVLYILIF